MKILEFDANNASERVLRGVYEVVAAYERDEVPGDEPAPFLYHLTRWQASCPEHDTRDRFYAEIDGEVVGFADIKRLPLDDPANMQIWLMVSPRHRDGGVGERLLAHVIDWGEQQGVERLAIDLASHLPDNDEVERLGMSHVLTLRRNRLLTRDIDWDLMDRWVQRFRERSSAEYELVRFETRVPDEHLEAWARIKCVMNDAPDGELEHEALIMTPEKWRAEEEETEARGDDYYAIGALHKATGEFAGFTDVFLPRHWQTHAWQEDTGVHHAHRGRGLGKWLKAEMARWLRADRPQIERIDTMNAGSNAPMLAINVEMGFRPLVDYKVWQAPTEVIRARLAAGTFAV